MYTGLIAAAALLLDRTFGEPPNRLHPLVYFGAWADAVERRCRHWVQGREQQHLRAAGVLALLLAVLPPVCVVAWLCTWDGLALWVTIACGYLAIGLCSLREHAEQVLAALTADNLPLAREQLARIVSRDVTQADAGQISTATVESVLENGSDAVFGALFWLAIAGAPGVVAYRLVNTLDAMWGYRNARYRDFGWAAARLDDAMGFIPARLAVVSYALAGHARDAWRAYREQAHLWYSPNAGPVMASGAGALGVTLGGEARYHGKTKPRPVLGYGSAAQPRDIARAIHLVERSARYWVFALLLIGLPLAVI